MAKRSMDNDGASRNGKATGGRFSSRIQAAANNVQPDWGRIDAELLWKLIQACTENDGAVMFGYSRDGGAYSVKIYEDGEPNKIYCHNDGELIDTLTYLLEA